MCLSFFLLATSLCQFTWHFPPSTSTSHAFLPGCVNEQRAAVVLGYTKASWDNLSGKEKQPSSWDKYWAELTDKEKAAAVVLGYTATIWDNESGSEPQPASVKKYWAELRACGEDLPMFFTWSHDSSDAVLAV